MGAKKKALILSTALLTGSFAYADNVESVVPLQSEQGALNHTASHIDYLSSRFFTPKEKPIGAEPALGNEVGDAQTKAALPNSSPPAGLHWSAGDQHPVLEYRFSNQGALHFHLGRHGATAGAAWKF